MKTRWMLSGLLLGSTLALVGCGAGQYQIPNVEPVVKPKPGDDLLDNISGDDKTAAPSESTAPSSSDEPAPASAPADSSKSPDSAKKK
jgi:hypothetical protein